jgi:methylated-DNA-[protein]-cysteine S-methyltransferase
VSCHAPYQAKLEVPFGVLGIRTEGELLADIVFLPRTHKAVAPANLLAERACRQVERYVADPAFRFDLPLQPCGTDFQRRVWRQITSIPTGRTRSYGEIAKAVASSPRPVGQACGSNPFPLVVPCHRVVAASGMGGFAHHAEGFLIGVKRWLLAHELR